MITSICPKLPMRDAAETERFYVEKMGFERIGKYPEYLILERDAIELHFFLHHTLDITTNDGQVYFRVQEIDALYNAWKERGVAMHPNGPLENKPWGQREFSVLDPDNNLLTFGEAIE